MKRILNEKKIKEIVFLNTKRTLTPPSNSKKRRRKKKIKVHKNRAPLPAGVLPSSSSLKHDPAPKVKTQKKMASIPSQKKYFTG